MLFRLNIIDALKSYEQLAKKHVDKTPKEFQEIKAKFQYAKDNGIRVLAESSDLQLPQSVVMDIKYVGDRWCQGIVTYDRTTGVDKVPYTIHYSDVYAPTTSMRIIFEGDNPYEQVNIEEVEVDG